MKLEVQQKKTGEIVNYFIDSYLVGNEKTKYITIRIVNKKEKIHLLVNNAIDVFSDSEVTFEVNVPQKLDFEIKLNSIIDAGKINIQIEEHEKKPLSTIKYQKEKTLVITDEYPSQIDFKGDLYHQINKLYEKNGINVQVACVNNSWYELNYIYDGIEVYSGNVAMIKEILLRQDFKNIIVNSPTIEFMELLDGYTNLNQNIIFRVFDGLLLSQEALKTAPYFMKKQMIDEKLNCLRNKYLNLYAESENVTWIFASEKLEKLFKEKYNLQNSLVTNYSFDLNSVSQQKKYDILLINNFDNDSKYAVADSIQTILRLSNYQDFKDYKIAVYGSGNFYKQLIEPINRFSNIEFINHNISIIEKNKLLALSKYYLNFSKTITDYEVQLAAKNHTILITGINKLLSDYENVVECADFIQSSDYIRTHKYEDFNFAKKAFDANIVNEIKMINSLIKKKNKFENFKKSNSPLLTIAIPCYNVENYLNKCFNSLIFQKNVNKLEILAINDGSPDNLRDIVLRYERLTKGIIKLIDKENGGHGSAVNLGVKLAKGKYFKILDSDDWLYSKNLELLINYLEKSDSDLIINKVQRDYLLSTSLDEIVEYDNLKEGIIYNFDDLIVKNYGFLSAPIFAACVYKTDTLRKANFSITEKKLYADHEFDALMMKCLKTVEYYPIPVYMYLIGREGQSISSNVWEKRYKDHQNAIFTLLDKLQNDIEFPQNRVEFISRMNLTPMITHQIDTMLVLNKREEIINFLEKLKSYETEYKTIKQTILDDMYIIDDIKMYFNTDDLDVLQKSIKKKEIKMSVKKILKKIGRRFL